jgi:prepilin-type N-terminal cleavage/methylation domain-containing protein
VLAFLTLRLTLGFSMKASFKNVTKTRAFTLLEVLVALLIFSLGAVVLGSAYLNLLNSYVAVGRGTEYLQDIALVRQQLMTQPDLTTAQNGDEFDTLQIDPNKAVAHIKWNAAIESAGTADLFNVTLTCVISTTDISTPTKTVIQNFTLLRPTWSDPTEQTTLRQAAATRIGQMQGTIQQ